MPPTCTTTSSTSSRPKEPPGACAARSCNAPQWPRIGGTKLLPLPSDAFLTDTFLTQYRPGFLTFAYAAGCGYHPHNPSPITEDVPTRGTAEHYYSEQKAALEATLAEVTAGSGLQVYVLRPCIVAGPKAPALADAMPWSHGPGPVRSAVRAVLVVPDPGIPLQLAHHDDVAAAIALAATTSAPPCRPAPPATP